ncbi:rhodanese-like domain-containing protein [Williamsia sterculiae]|uniref:Rhodanese-related sulfurtransferase n=1 Tax=Williamsia sterculiae TaxID=1344003 RepID=A0A1N7HFW3_9NOCA|nr:rhodanese-like domain-containing protein [Williamsia sterculiae]SIS23777.1 Rhodanese-related sulfurtransferase [Williamsia sterculiae]
MSVVDSITAREAVRHRDSQGALVVDLRPQVVRHQGSLPGAVVVEPDDLEAAFAPTSARRIPAIVDLDTEIAVVSIRAQAQRIAARIAALGYTNVSYVEGGYQALCSAVA